ncbi:hypothetical protein V5799_004461 [Amblyomma americanum]|uniref:Uncharacterized protein n=1 Tax=Amblyomma americanum TaxID=6943 RepID=A0AAQ4D621_AMBAM
MLRTAVETKLLNTEEKPHAPVTISIDVVEDEGSSSEAEKDSDEEELEKLVFGTCHDTVESSHVSLTADYACSV